MKRTNLLTVRSKFIWRSNWFSLTNDRYHKLIFKDYMITLYLTSIFKAYRFPTSSFFLNYILPGFLFIECNIYIVDRLHFAVSRYQGYFTFFTDVMLYLKEAAHFISYLYLELEDLVTEDLTFFSITTYLYLVQEYYFTDLLDTYLENYFFSINILSTSFIYYNIYYFYCYITKGANCLLSKQTNTFFFCFSLVNIDIEDFFFKGELYFNTYNIHNTLSIFRINNKLIFHADMYILVVAYLYLTTFLFNYSNMFIYKYVFETLLVLFYNSNFLIFLKILFNSIWLLDYTKSITYHFLIESTINYTIYKNNFFFFYSSYSNLFINFIFLTAFLSTFSLSTTYKSIVFTNLVSRFLLLRKDTVQYVNVFFNAFNASFLFIQDILVLYQEVLNTDNNTINFFYLFWLASKIKYILNFLLATYFKNNYLNIKLFKNTKQTDFLILFRLYISGSKVHYFNSYSIFSENDYFLYSLFFTNMKIIPFWSYVYYLNNILFLRSISYSIESTLLAYCDSLTSYFFPSYFLFVKPYLTSAKLLCDYIYFKITNSGKIFDAYNSLRKWQIKERSLLDYGYGISLNQRTSFLALYQISTYQMKRTFLSILLRSSLLLRNSMFRVMNELHTNIGGIRVVCSGPPYKGKRTLKTHYHLWVSDYNIIGDMPYQTFVFNIDYFQTTFTFKQATFGLKVWLLLV